MPSPIQTQVIDDYLARATSNLMRDAVISMTVPVKVLERIVDILEASKE
jgi:hypothetical protein